MHVSDEHLVWIQVEVEGDGADAVFGAGWTEVAQLGASWALEMQFETPLLVQGADHGHRCFGEIAFQQGKFFSLHRCARVRIPGFLVAHSSTWCRCCNGAVRGAGQALPWSYRKKPIILNLLLVKQKSSCSCFFSQNYQNPQKHL